MDRSTVLRWLVIAAAVFLFWQFGLPLITGKSDKVQSLPDETYVDAPGFVPDVLDPHGPHEPTEGETCKIQGNRFDAMLSSRGAAITHLYLREAQYAGPEGFNLSTTPDHERWRSLRTLFRGPDAQSQVKYDRFLWKLDRFPEDKGCTFTYEDDDVRIVKDIVAGERPFELHVETKVQNLAQEAKRHQLAIGTYSYRTNAEVKGSLGRVSPFQTELSCAGGGDVVRKDRDDFASGWFAVPSVDRYAAINTHYFAQALIPQPSDAELPRCEILAEEWIAAGQAHDADDAGAIYHARLVYPAKELAPEATAAYRQIGFFGPKERDVLASAAGGDKLKDVINLGFFTPVAKELVRAMVFIREHLTFGNWGMAIIVMTIVLRLILFPLTFKSIKTTIAMRRLKPEVDALNAKFKDDAQAKNLAMMELWKKHGVNPFGGCLPQLVQMPVWFAMYTTLQTAVEMYHTKFLWFDDLSSPDRFYILPLLLGVFMIVQQRIVPQQGMDPMQQKMMMWMLPGVFTVMMLFLPAALGVYMLTNSVLGIAQQLIVEKVAPRDKADKNREIVVKQKDSKDATSDPKGPKSKTAMERLGKGKARV
jgi:YidC/Oxa1 family membrane protein insertase